MTLDHAVPGRYRIPSPISVLIQLIIVITGIYALFDSFTNECLYVGQSKDIEIRYFEHLKALKKGTHKRKDFVEWFQSNNLDSNLLSCCLLEECENDDVVKNELEIKWFNELSPRFYGKYPSINEKWKHTQESKRNISEGLKKFNLKQGKTSIGREIFNCKICNKKTSRKEKLCVNCFRECSKCVFDLKYKNLILEEYLKNHLSIREILRNYKINVKRSYLSKRLQEWGVVIIERTFDGKNHSKESKKIIKEKLIAQNSEKGKYAICENCKKLFRYKESQPRRFCSKICYFNKSKEINMLLRPRQFDICPSCLQEFSFIPSRPKKYCSKKCCNDFKNKRLSI